MILSFTNFIILTLEACPINSLNELGLSLSNILIFESVDPVITKSFVFNTQFISPAKSLLEPS